MAQDNETITQLEVLEDVTGVESETAERTYIVWLYGYADPRVLEEIERVSGWSLSSFYGTNGRDVGLCYAATEGEDTGCEYGVSLTAFDVERYEDQDH